MNKNRNKIAAMIIAGALVASYVPSGVYAAEVGRSESKVDKKVDEVKRSIESDVDAEDDEQSSNQQSTEYGCFEVINEDNTCEVNYKNNVLTINGSGAVIISTPNNDENNKATTQIVVESEFNGTINLDGVNIENDKYPFLIQGGASPTINIMEGSNNSFAGGYAGIELHGENANLTITADSEEKNWGTLKATVVYDGVGIGSDWQGGYESITIEGGNIIATAGESGAGIGSGSGTGIQEKNCGNIIIEGGNIIATAGYGGAGIGSGQSGSCGSISIRGGTVTATAGESGAGIGSGYRGSCKSITIEGGSVKSNSKIDKAKNKENGDVVYLVELEGQDDFGSVEVDRKDYNIPVNHKSDDGTIDTTLYLYMTIGKHTVITKQGEYIVIIDENGKYKISEEIDTGGSIGGGGIYIPPTPTYNHTQIIGSDRYETAGLIADKLGSYDTAVLVNATSTMSDGLSASGLAGKEDAAILLTKKDSIPKATIDRLKKVKKVYIIGGENAISKKVSDEITKNIPKVEVERLGGKTRVETSELVAKEIGNYDKAFVVNGFKGEADAMSASSIAAKEEAPIILTNGKDSTYAKKSGVEYYVVGGNNVMDDSILKKYSAERIAGDDRYETNREIITEFYGETETLYFANGETLVDALTASTIAKKDGLVLVGRKSDNKILNKKNTIQVGGMKFDVDFEK